MYSRILYFKASPCTLLV